MGDMYVYRLEKRRAWLVKQKPYPTRSFSDAMYGGKEKARQAAIRWRDRRKPNVPHPPVHASNSRNTSGVIGVSKYISANTKQHLGWIAFWWENDRQHNVRFTFKRHGRMAYQRAVECREEAETRLNEEACQ